MWSRVRVVATLVAIATLTTTACGGGTSVEALPDAAHLEVERLLRGIPEHPRAERVGLGGSRRFVEATFAVNHVTPQQVVQYYVDELPPLGWGIAFRESARGDDGAIRARFEDDERALLVSARESPATPTVTRFTLVVREHPD